MLPLLCCLVLAQEPPSFRATVPLVVAPATVTGRDGKFIDGLRVSDFAVYVDGRRQSIDAETEHEPLSLVIAVETNADSEAALAKLRKTGSLFEPLVLGARGEAAVIAYSDEPVTVQNFTSDSDAIQKALARLSGKPLGGVAAAFSGAKLLDAIASAVSLLETRPPNRRRVILFVGESKDRGSKLKIEEALTRAQRANVLIYALTFSPYATPFTARPGDLPPAGGMNLLAALAEIGRAGKRNAANSLTTYTGGKHAGFLRQKGLEQAIARIGEELHSQYILSFTPQSRGDGRYHSIEVRVPSRPGAVVRARSGFWD